MSAETTTETKEKAKPPVAEVREGSVKIAVWERQSDKGPFFTTGKPQLSYKDSDGNWHNDAGSYSEFDLVDLIVAAAKAKAKIRELRIAAKTATPGDDE